MRIVIIESPYAGDIARNVDYARRAMLDSLARGEAPFVSHLLYTQVLQDEVVAQRELGMAAGMKFYYVAELCAVYDNWGITPGMQVGITRAESLGIPIEYRRLRENLEND